MVVIWVRVWIGVIDFFKNYRSPNVSFVAKWIRGWTANLEVESSNPRSAG